MDPITIGVVGLFVMLILILVGVPIAFAMAVVGIVGIMVIDGFDQAMAQISMNTTAHGSNFVYVALPLFVLMGQLVRHSNLATDLWVCVRKWIGHVPGGLAITAVGCSAGFGSITGSSIATVATMAPISMPEMAKSGYDARLATGSIAASGTLAIVVPPSVFLVVYGIWTETSIARLFAASIIPALLLALLFAAYILIRCAINPELGPVTERVGWGERFSSMTHLLPLFVIFFVVVGGIYGGVFTPSEAAGVGTVAVTIVAGLMGRMGLEEIRKSLYDTGRIAAMIFALILSGHITGTFLVTTGLTKTLVAGIIGLGVNRYLVMAMFCGMYIFLGAMLEVWAMLILTLPVVFPVILALGFDPVWFGVWVVIMAEIALIVPPHGTNVCLMYSLAPDVPLVDIFKGALPFLGLTLVVVVALTAFPDLALFLPRMTNGK